MRRRRFATIGLACALTIGHGAAARAASVVFNGDPVDAGSGQPYEILPGQPLVTPGGDGRLGTADDVVNPGVIGDVDLVVRLGTVPMDSTIPSPARERNAVATATAGLRGAGVAIPFRVYLSDGAVALARPYGNLLAAADMTGLPVIVMLFADRNGDKVIGPAGRDPRRDVRALAELEPVGTEVALFDGTGQASGTIVATVGGPASQGGVTLVATATAFTGTYDPQVFKGVVPTGPAITTAQPYLPERDPARIFTDVGPLVVDGTLNPRLRAAAIPDPNGTLHLALSIKTSSPTTDTARAVAGPAVCARVVEPGRGLPSEPPSLALGTLSSAGRLKLAVVAVDRLGNPTDPTPGLVARLVTDAPLAITPDMDTTLASENVPLTQAKSEQITLRATGVGAGSLRVLVGGALCQRLEVSVRAERNRGASDAVVALKGRADYSSLAAAAVDATDRNGDGRITITVGEGVFRETVLVTRAIEVIGSGSGRTIVDARGLGTALTIGSVGAKISGLTASGGTTGIAVDAPITVTGLEARGNVGAGIQLGTSGAGATACVARENGGAGFSLIAPATLVANLAIYNAGAGISSTTTVAGVGITDNVLTLNTGEGVLVLDGVNPMITGNAIGGGFGEGISLDGTTGGTVTGNRAAGNDGNGISLIQSDGALIDGNDFSTNHGYGVRIDRATADFAAAPGTQAPAGNNDVSDNRRGEIQIK